MTGTHQLNSGLFLSAVYRCSETCANVLVQLFISIAVAASAAGCKEGIWCLCVPSGQGLFCQSRPAEAMETLLDMQFALVNVTIACGTAGNLGIGKGSTTNLQQGGGRRTP
jgi:hypothetical protein